MGTESTTLLSRNLITRYQTVDIALQPNLIDYILSRPTQVFDPRYGKQCNRKWAYDVMRLCRLGPAKNTARSLESLGREPNNSK